MLDRLTSLPIAGDRVFGAIRRFYDRLDGVRDLLTDGDITSARLVVNPERMVVAEARRTYTYLSLFGYHVDAVIANRMLPDRDRRSVVRAVEGDAVGAPRHDRGRVRAAAGARRRARRTTSSPASTQLAAFGADALRRRAIPRRGSPTIEPLRVDAVGTTLVLSVHLPFTERDDVRLGRSDEELFLTVGPHRRAFVLPDSLLRREVGGARLDGDRLEVEFV